MEGLFSPTGHQANSWASPTLPVPPPLWPPSPPWISMAACDPYSPGGHIDPEGLWPPGSAGLSPVPCHWPGSGLPLTEAHTVLWLLVVQASFFCSLSQEAFPARPSPDTLVGRCVGG